MKGYLGYHGCTACMIEGKRLENRQVFPQPKNGVFEKRKQEDIITYSETV